MEQINYLRKCFLRDIWWTPSIVQIKIWFSCLFVILNSQTLWTLDASYNKGRGVFRTSSSSQASKDEYAVCNFVTSEGGGVISSAENTADIEEKHDNGNVNNIATYKEKD